MPERECARCGTRLYREEPYCPLCGKQYDYAEYVGYPDYTFVPERPASKNS